VADFPLSKLYQVLTEGVIDPAVFGGLYSFLDDQFDLYQFRKSLALHFPEALSGGKEKRSFRFDTHCNHIHCFLTRDAKTESAREGFAA